MAVEARSQFKMDNYTHPIKGLHHNVYACRDSEETRKFYEDILGLRLATAFELTATKTGRPVKALHSFYEMHDHSFLAFFEVPGEHSEEMFENKSDFDLHIALEVEGMDTLLEFLEKGKKAGINMRGPSDHGFCHSIYFRDPNGYVIELTTKDEKYDEWMDQSLSQAHGILKNWQENRWALVKSLKHVI